LPKNAFLFGTKSADATSEDGTNLDVLNAKENLFKRAAKQRSNFIFNQIYTSDTNKIKALNSTCDPFFDKKNRKTQKCQKRFILN
jgi:hypothetical protein